MTDAEKKVAEDVLRIRLSQMVVNERYKAGAFRVPIHLALGHEAIAVAVDRVMESGDKLLLSHRNMAYNLARAGALKPILHEYLLLPDGLDRATFGSMNLVNPARGIVYTSSILGNNFAVATGIAMAEKVRETNGLTIVLGGDGSMEEGAFHESAVILRSLALPAFIVVENNEWSMATCIADRRCGIDIEKFAASVGMPYAHLSGNDPFAYLEALRKLRQTAFERRTPIMIEVTVTTLGDWRGPKTPEHPEGRFINYHAGPTPSIEMKEWPVIRETEEDPVYVLEQRFGADTIHPLAVSLAADIMKEIA